MNLEQLWPVTEEVIRGLEQCVNDGSPSGWTDGPHQVSPHFRPQPGSSAFPLPVVEVPESEFSLIGAPEPLLEGARAGFRYFPAHPDVVSRIEHTARTAVEVWATSSGRTVTVNGSSPLRQLKLHYPSLLGRAPRELTERRVRMSTAVTEELERVEDQLHPGVGFLPERGGAVLRRAGTDAELGMIVRDSSALLPASGELTTIPWFSLTATDRSRRGDDTLLAQMVSSWNWTLDDFLGHLVVPLFTSFFELAGRWGLIPEAHGQNLVVSVDRAGRVHQVVHRDFLDFVVDPWVRRDRELGPCPGPRQLDAADPDALYAWRSWAFDFKLGEYALGAVVEGFAGVTGTPVESVRRACVAACHEVARTLEIDLRSYFRPWARVSYLDGRIPQWGRRPELLTRLGPSYR